MTSFKIHSHFYRMSLLYLGILSTLAYRGIIITNRYSLLWSDILWYFGTVGFCLYFIHRYNIDFKRDRLIEDQQLIQKIQTNKTIKTSDKQNLINILNSLSTSTAKWNYLAIFVLSVLALLYDLAIRFFFV